MSEEKSFSIKNFSNEKPKPRVVGRAVTAMVEVKSAGSGLVEVLWLAI